MAGANPPMPPGSYGVLHRSIVKHYGTTYCWQLQFGRKNEGAARRWPDLTVLSPRLGLSRVVSAKRPCYGSSDSSSTPLRNSFPGVIEENPFLIGQHRLSVSGGPVSRSTIHPQEDRDKFLQRRLPHNRHTKRDSRGIRYMPRHMSPHIQKKPCCTPSLLTLGNSRLLNMISHVADLVLKGHRFEKLKVHQY
jgi:hypothetical protein